MSSLTVALGSTQTYNTPGTTTFDPVTLNALSTLNISGADVNVILEDISAVAGSTIRVQDGATLTLSGASAGVLNSFVIGSNGTLNAGTVLSAANPISFSGTGGVLTVPEGVSLLSPISGFTAGNEVKTAGTISNYSYTPDLLTPTAGGTLDITDADGTTVAAQLVGNYTANSFQVDADGSIGVACYCRGTMIRTESGEVPVEQLRAGDRLLTISGQLRPIKWIGRRSYSGRFLRSHRTVLPVKIRAGALGEGRPYRDLMVSPDHAMYLDGVLVPARVLINHSSIEQLQECSSIEYFHVELEEHDVILAEGAPSETFLDDDSRGMFNNADEYAVLFPGPQPAKGYYARRLESGHEVEALRRRLAIFISQVERAA